MFVSLSRKKILACLIIGAVVIGLIGLRTIYCRMNNAEKICLTLPDEVQLFLDELDPELSVCCKRTIKGKSALSKNICFLDDFVKYLQRNSGNYSASQTARIAEASSFSEQAAKALQNGKNEYANLLYFHTLDLTLKVLFSHENSVDDQTSQSLDNYSLLAVKEWENSNFELAFLLSRVSKIQMFAAAKEFFNDRHKLKAVKQNLSIFREPEQIQTLEEKALSYALEALNAYQQQQRLLSFYLAATSEAHIFLLQSLILPEWKIPENLEHKYEQVIEQYVEAVSAHKKGNAMLAVYYFNSGFNVRYIVKAEKEKQFTAQQNYQEGFNYDLTAIKLETQGKKYLAYNYSLLAQTIFNAQRRKELNQPKKATILNEATSHLRVAISAEENGNRELSNYLRTLATCILHFTEVSDSNQKLLKQREKAIGLARAVVAAYKASNLSEAARQYEELNNWLEANNLQDVYIAFL